MICVNQRLNLTITFLLQLIQFINSCHHSMQLSIAHIACTSCSVFFINTKKLVTMGTFYIFTVSYILWEHFISLYVSSYICRYYKHYFGYSRDPFHHLFQQGPHRNIAPWIRCPSESVNWMLNTGEIRTNFNKVSVW